MSHKSWIYTLNNPTDIDKNQFKAFICNRHRCALEYGENNTPHLQGVITFCSSKRLSALKKLNGRAHWEASVSVIDALNYCTKGEIIIDEDNRVQGKRTELEDAIQTLKDTTSLREVALQHPLVWIKFKRGILDFWKEWTDENMDEWTPTEVIVIWGPTGTGKSRMAREIDKKLYNVPEPINGSLWLDNYRNESTILLDDFYGWIKYHTLLQLTDGYNFQLPIKGSFISRHWKRVIITSNNAPEDWYNRDEISALLRRITKIIHLESVEISEEIINEPVCDL